MVICFDLTLQSSFTSVKRWSEACKDNCEANIPILLVGNKSDMEDERKISREAAEELAASMGVSYTEVSAKENRNVNEVFEEIIDLVYKHKFAPSVEKDFGH